MHHSAWDTFVELTEVAKRLHLCGAGQDLPADAFSGNVRGAGPGMAEMEIFQRRARRQALEMADYMRRDGPFESGRLPMEDLEHTTMPQVAERMRERWEPIEESAPVPQR